MNVSGRFVTGCLIDVLSSDVSLDSCCDGWQHVQSLRNVLQTLFQMANMLLLLGSIVESALLLKIYLWYMLSFVIVGLVVAILDLCFRLKNEGVWSFITFVTEVTFLFVIFQCLPLVDSYKKGLEGV
ncbi:hypothetical protein KGM_213225 [Danaus plexippus plexippus]|uniref:Uncharacterized protein n=1 Tax=Danaus plexippus plexippus TaxID=278856 RepID=A0A212EPB1_DANPL|nr:hypothetical protein KGM_213225 [Danaus plexippus plexippus]